MQASARSALAASGSERWRSALGVALIHIVLGAALLSGLGVTIAPRPEPVTQLVNVLLAPPPAPVEIAHPPKPTPAAAHSAHGGASPRATPPAAAGGSPGPAARPASPLAPAPLVLNPLPPAGGGSGAGPALGSGSGGGTGGNGSGNGSGDGLGNGDGGTDLEQIAGEIRRSDYPRAAREARIGGRVEFRFTVGTDGRVRDCAITRSSGSADLDQTTCRLVTERFRYRPSTDSRGVPVADVVEGEHIWQAGRP